MQFFRLSATLRNTLVGLAPFLTHDNIVFLELLYRFETRAALVLDSLLGAFDSLECVLESEFNILEDNVRFREELEDSLVPEDLLTSALILSSCRSSFCLSTQS